MSAYYYICALLLLYICPPIIMYLSSCYYVSALLLLYICPHTTIYLPSYYCISVVILLHICRHTTTYLSSYYYIFVRILLYFCPHTTTNQPSYYCISIRIVLRPAAEQSIQQRGLRWWWEGVTLWVPPTLSSINYLPPRTTFTRTRACTEIRPYPPPLWYSIYLLYWYKSTNTDAEGAARYQA